GNRPTVFARRGAGGRGPTRLAGVFGRASDKIAEALAKVLGTDLLELGRDLPAETSQVVVADERRHQVAGAHERGAKFDRRKRPRLLDPPQDARSQRGGASVTGLQPVECPGEIAVEPRLIHAVMAQDPRGVAIRRLDELHEE